MTTYFYVIYDCANLGEKPGNALGKRFLSQRALDDEIASATHAGVVDSKLPMYVRGNEMVLDQLYRTRKFLNAGCCSLHVIASKDSGTLESGSYYRFSINKSMSNEMFGKTNTHDSSCSCVVVIDFE